MKLAIIETGGKQYLILPDKKIKIEKIKNISEGEEVIFDKVLLIAETPTGKTEEARVIVGKPYIEGAKVTGKVIKSGRGKKIIVFRYHPKTRYRKKKGHRQPYMEVQIAEVKDK
ncbi:50S ribosomal protein L21 [bacterium]|nr:50S ribosomal protein L21 [bacterium]